MNDDPKAALKSLNIALALAADLIQDHLPTIQAFLEEERHVDSVMPIVDPSLWMNQERRETAVLLSPVYRSAKAFADAMAAAQATAADRMAERVRPERVRPEDAQEARA